jgi:hypothetical protein
MSPIQQIQIQGSLQKSVQIWRRKETTKDIPIRFPGRASSPKNFGLDFRARARFDKRDARPSMPTMGFVSETCIACAVPSAVMRDNPSAKIDKFHDQGGLSNDIVYDTPSVLYGCSLSPEKNPCSNILMLATPSPSDRVKDWLDSGSV